ncbi:MAG: hypothetical protein BGO67_08585 [Alphaproteobacteria bacterium 41-28]|nr:MAG: hypothetical protein BGO67_08585 [Alphaproteobacteria bacterium 41-28]
MNVIADIHAPRPFYGYCKVTIVLKGKGHQINSKKVRKLMKQMGLPSILPKPIRPFPIKILLFILIL